MANVKGRAKAPKSASTKPKGPGKSKSSTGTNNNLDTNRVMRRPSNLKVMTSEEKVQILLQNGHLLKDKFMTRQASNESNKKSFSDIASHVTKSGRIKKKNKDQLKLIDNILKSELLIEDNKSKSTRKGRKNIENNNSLEINDQNKPKESATSPASNIVTRRASRENKLKELEFRTRKPSQKSTNIKLNNTFECDYCKKMFNKKSSLRRHMYMHLDMKPHCCPQCPRKFRQRFNLQIHVKRQHPDFDISSFDIQQPVNSRYACTICPKTYDSKTRLVLHIKSHLKIKDYICDFCGKEFLRVNSVKRHVQVCHIGHQIQCPICKKYLKGHLTEHMRTHNNKRPHECEFCGQRFTQSTQLNVHRRSHTGARPYPCKICGRPFSHSNALMLHIRRHTGEKPFVCAMCPISFSQLPHMKAHMRNIHGKENPYKCVKCNQFFKLKVELENHSKICTVGAKQLSFEEQIQESIKIEDVEMEPVMNLSRMRFLLALLLTMVASKEKLKYLGFNKRLIDDILMESLEAMGQVPCRDQFISPLKRLKTNIEILLDWTVPKDQMEKFRVEKKTTEELLELLTDSKKKAD